MVVFNNSVIARIEYFTEIYYTSFEKDTIVCSNLIGHQDRDLILMHPFTAYQSIASYLMYFSFQNYLSLDKYKFEISQEI